MARPLAVLLALVLVALSGCKGLNEHGADKTVKKGGPPEVSASSNSESATEELGFPVTATKNTTRVPGADAVADVAGVVSAVFPSTSRENRPNAVAMVEKTNWQGAIAASVLMARPLGIPILLSDGGNLAPVSSNTLARLKPKGSPLAQRAQIVRIGDDAARPSGYRSARISAPDPYELAGDIDRFFSVARSKPSPDVIIASGEQPAFAMPAAAWAARAGDSVLFVRHDVVPPATREALRRHDQPNIYVLGPSSVIGPKVTKVLRKLGNVSRVGGPTPVLNAIAFTRYQSHGFGWGISTPGQNFTVASTSRPSDAAGAAVLATTGVFAPLLLTDRADALPSSLENYFLDVQPGFQSNPNAGVFNHVWILGDDSALSVGAQGRLDTITELVPVQSRQP